MCEHVLYTSSSLCCQLPSVRGCCVVMMVQKEEKTTSVLPKKMSCEGIDLHYGFNLFEKFTTASNLEY